MQKHVEIDEPEEAPELESSLFGVAEVLGVAGMGEEEIEDEAVEGEELGEDVLSIEDDTELAELPELPEADSELPEADSESFEEEAP
jgi:hypothetical protein